MYNKDMNTIIIEGPERAIRAGTWADKNIKNGWELDMINPLSKFPSYAFKFANSLDASFFALKWTQ